MMKTMLPLLCVLWLPATAWGEAPRLEDFLPGGGSYDEAVPRPSSVLGWEIGEWHVRHDQLVRYAEVLAESSERVRLEIQGHTHERRPQPLLIISSPANLARLEEIREARGALVDPSRPMPSPEELEAMPVVVLLGYSIHGNEASGANASLAVAYHLAAGQGPEVETVLENAVVLLDPSFNPDGLGRFAQWVNMHRGARLVGDPEHREHQEVWPGGRTNHYWFDLNRDWLLLQHPESRNRLETFHRWHPNLLGDYHEMGSDATFFFQPGVPARQNPLTPLENLELTRQIAAFHAEVLDRERRYYYTEETFDDFYPGKGSTYPDLNGAVGVLFEQASARGHLQDTANGPLSFSFAIRNQALTSYSMLRAAVAKRQQLLDYQARFFRTALEDAAKDGTAGYLFSLPGDPARAAQLLDLLQRHRIEVHALARPVALADGNSFEPESSWIVPLAQPQYRLIQALFETRREFSDSIFYDVSAWTLPLAFGARQAALPVRAFSQGLLGEKAQAALPPGRFEASPAAVAYLFDWSSYYAPRALGRLLEAGVRARVAARPFEAVTPAGGRHFERGSILIPVGLPRTRPVDAAPGVEEDLEALLRTIAEQDGVDVYAATTGLTPVGGDLGSPNALTLERPRPLLLVGEGVSPYEAGEVWHLLDHRFGIGLSMVESARLDRVDLESYTHLLMVQGGYGGLGGELLERLRRWIRGGGVQVASRSAAQWVDEKLFPPPPDDEKAPKKGETAPAPPVAALTGAPAEPAERIPYGDYESRRAQELVSGAIFEVELDLTHPLAFGYGVPRLPVFRTSTQKLEVSDNPFENVALYTAAPRLAGYASAAKIEQLAGTAALRARREGRGTVIQLADNPNFRGFWLGTHKLYLNALFFGSVIHPTQPPAKW